MVKSRMTALDVRASVEEMQSTLVGLRLLNIYDINDKRMFLFKFGHGENKRTVLLENGLRFHLTDLVREKPKVPSQFTLGLRKMVRAWRLDSVAQLQHDRTIDMCFGVAAEEGKSFHIIIELFGKGNVILTDHAYVIKVLLRTHKDADVGLRVGSPYPVAGAEPSTEDEATAALDDASVRQKRLDALRAEWQFTWDRNGDEESVRSTLSGVHHFGPALADHILAVTGVANRKKKDLVAAGEDPARVFDALAEGMLAAVGLVHMALPTGGYLIRNPPAGNKKKKKAAGDEEEEAAALNPVETTTTAAADGAASTSVVVAERYDDFTPVLLAQFTKPGVRTEHKDSFGKVCDVFFLPTEADKIDQHNDKKDKKAESKREKFERDHQRRLTALEREQAISQRKGELLMMNADIVDEAIALINGALATGIQWDALKTLLRRRHADGHPVAYMIHELKLEKNMISVLLERSDLYDDEDAVDVEPEVVDVDLSKTAHANASDYFTKKKANKTKYDKTIAATDKAAAGAARKADRVANTKVTKKQIVKERTRAWWEKLFWFRTSAGDVVFQGKDVQTTELLIRRTMRLGDVFVHCDVSGALPCVLRPMQGAWEVDVASAVSSASSRPVSMKSIEEAGAWCVSRSAAWESKQSIGSWWVYASQITGGTASGCYLYSGERHIILPQPLSLGCGLLFKVTRTLSVCDVTTELPSFLTSAAGADADSSAAGTCVPPDPAESLSPLPSVESLRQSQRKATQRGGPSVPIKKKTAAAPAPTAAADAAEAAQSNEAVATTVVMTPKYHKDRKAKKMNKYFTASEAPQPHRNARANKSEDGAADKKGTGRWRGQECDEAEEETVASSYNRGGAGVAEGRTSPQPPQQALTRHQKKKLKKIKEKYGDQDDEDRMRGAMLNGNYISKVQARELELQAARERAEKLVQKKEAKEARDRLKARGKLQYHQADDSHDEEADDEATSSFEDVEEVSDFSEDADGRTGVETAPATAGDKDSSEKGESDDEEEDAPSAEPATDALACESEKSAEDTTRRQSVSAHTQTNLAPEILSASKASDDELKKVFPHYTCCPKDTDVVEHVLCVCAPFSTLVTGGYTYRMALACAVGTVKKGQIARTVLENFLCLQRHSAAAATASTEEKTMHVDPSSSASQKKPQASTRSSIAPAVALVPTSPSLLAEMELVNINDVVDQLRGNVKPITLKSK